VLAAVDSTAKLALADALVVRATSDNKAQANSDAGTGALIGIAQAKPVAIARSATTARLDGDLTSANLITVDAIGANSAFANSALVAVGLGAGADATPIATVETGALTLASIGASAEIATPGADIVVRATANNSALALCRGGGRSRGRCRQERSRSAQQCPDEASLLGNIRVVSGSDNLAGARDVSVIAQGTDTTIAQIRSIVGGGISVNLATSTADTSPAVTATIGTSGSLVVASRDITVRALGTTDADTSTRSTTGGGVAIANYSATASASPSVTTTVGGGAFLKAAGLITISAAHNQLQTPLSDGTFNSVSGVNDAANTITFALPHGLRTGDAVTYNAQGSPVVSGLLTAANTA
jgi:mucin-19